MNNVAEIKIQLHHKHKNQLRLAFLMGKTSFLAGGGVPQVPHEEHLFR